jgi:hypothetical protein
MVDSGQAYSRGAETPEEAYTKYKAMIDAALPRPALANITAQYWREGSTIHVTGTVTNNSEVTLSAMNLAGFSATVKWPGPRLPFHVTNQAALYSATTSIEYLEPGETGTYQVSVPISDQNVNWEQIEVYTMVDYETAPGAIFDQLQAARATEIADPGTINAQPNQFHLLIPAEQTVIEDLKSVIQGTAGTRWTASVDESWLTLDKTSGYTGDTITLSINRSALTEGWQDAIVRVTPGIGNDITSIYVRIYLGYPGEIRSIHLPLILR